MFSSYANLHKLLSDADQQILSSTSHVVAETQQKSLTLDSRIISASFLKKHQNQFSVKSPVVKITFQHLSGQQSEEMDRYCVFWDLQEENWSDQDCQIIETNQTHTQCSCSHLTHFALLAPVNNQDSGLVGNGLDFLVFRVNKQN